HLSAADAATRAGELDVKMNALLRWTKTHPPNERFAAHLSKNRGHLFRFLRDRAVDATNWQAEQALRPAVVNRKVWGGNRTDAGAAAQAVLMSVLATARQVGRDALDFLSLALRSPVTRALLTAA